MEYQKSSSQQEAKSSSLGAEGAMFMAPPAFQLTASAEDASSQKAPIQRVIASATLSKHFTPSHAEKEAANLFFEKCDEKVNEAYNFIISAPGLGPWAGMSSKHISHWLEVWQPISEQSIEDIKPSQLSTSFGYAVETLVSAEDAPFRPTPPPSCSIGYQETVGHTRPDAVLYDPYMKPIAWLDITASNSEGHIFDKDKWEKKIGIFAESTYPSLERGHIQAMIDNKHNTSSYDPDTVKEKLETAQAEYEFKKEKWYEWGENFLARKLRSKSGVKQWEINLPNKDIKQRLHTFLQDKFAEAFHVKPNVELLSSILSAMQIPLKPWLLHSGYTASAVRGELWLKKVTESWDYKTAAISLSSASSSAMDAIHDSSAAESETSLAVDEDVEMSSAPKGPVTWLFSDSKLAKEGDGDTEML